MLQSVDERELFYILQNLISIESVNPSLEGTGQGEGRIAEYIGAFLIKIGLSVTYQTIGPDRLNVVGVLKGKGGGKSLMLNGHTDTVGLSGMTVEALKPELKSGRVYGRGSLDMKSGLAAMIMAAKAVKESGAELLGDVVLAFVADEEFKSQGTEALVKDFRADAAIVCEPTKLGISPAHKGFAWLNIDVHGKAAHGSRPDLGVDAIVKAGKFLCALDRYEKDVLFKRKHPLLGSPSVHASMIQGGGELSTYPDLCKIQLERRTIPGESDREIVREINALMDALKEEDRDFNASCELFFSRSAMETSLEEEIYRTLTRAYQTTLGSDPVVYGTSGWMDSAILADAGIPTVIFGACGEGLHAAAEYVDFKSVVDVTRVLTQTIIDFCGVCEMPGTPR